MSVSAVTGSWTMLRILPDAIETHERWESEPGAWHAGRVLRHPRHERS